MSDDICFASAHELGSRYRRGDLSPVEVAQAILERIDAANPRLNAFITVTADLALEQARAAERRLREAGEHHPLLGVPYTLKDLYATAGVRTTAGSRILADWVPTFDSTVHARLQAAGAVLLGKTNTSEYAAGPTNANVWYGQAYNPWRLDRVPGGSSGGAGAAVASGLGPIGCGSDTGGSIRIPAALCGVVGLKATYGRISAYGVVPLCWSQDHAGPLTRSVADAALVLQTVAGHDPRDPNSATAPVDDYLAALEGDVRGLRVGVPRSHFFEQLDPVVESFVEAAIEMLRGMGVAVREIAIPWVEDAVAAANVISYVEAADCHRDSFAARPADLGPEVQDRVLVGTVLRGVDYVRAQRVRASLAERSAELFGQVDALVTPTTAITAPPVGAKRVRRGGRDVLVRPALTRLTRLHNVVGLPALTLPCGFDDDGLPVGLQIAARPFDESTVLRLARAYERATDWHTRRPRLE
ncbi:MAG: Asp-tRNA(Asn)/Glu-tRNA(Gln) amidotransferase subunit GatA [Chloroflexi bacterium]|nr:Asp-tRNA(Asn)/Glu-tRNA(Gln) amidotransferase subunit GatA [Chloroflexota bacterium]